VVRNRVLREWRLRWLTVAVGISIACPEFSFGQEVPTGPITIDSVAVRGNVRQTDEIIIANGTLVPGTAYTIFDIQKATKSLWSTGQFKDITVHVDGEVGEGVTLVWEVEEQDLMRNIGILGLKSLDADQVMDTTALKPGRPFSLSAVSEAKRFIQNELAKKGIPFVNIKERIEPISGREKEILFFLDVEEGSRVTIADILVKGNTVFTADELRGAMAVKEEGFFWWRGGVYDGDKLNLDLTQNLPTFYATRGHLDFEVADDSLIIDPSSGKTRLELTVEEGSPYHLNSFSITGNSEFSREELSRRYFGTNNGLVGDPETLPVFDASHFDAVTGEISQLYQNSGFLFSQIVPFVNVEPEVEGEIRKVRAGWDIIEGNPAYVSRVNIQGNDFTHDAIIRDKIFVLPGDVYSQERVIESFQSISSLGFFEVPMQVPSIDPNQDGDVDITFNVTEKATGALNFGTSVGGYQNGLSGFIGYDQPNLFGKGKNGSLRWDYGTYMNNQNLSYSDPGIFESLVSGSVQLFNSRDRFISFRSGRRKKLGGLVRFGFLLPNARFTRLYTAYGISQTSLKLMGGTPDLDNSLFGRPDATQSTISVGITRNTQNHPLFPTAGSRHAVNFEFTGGPLGGDGRFIKSTANGSWWTPIGVMGANPDQPGSGTTFALGTSLRFGALQGDSDSFPFDRFWMGGVQFGESLRGYDETTITPTGYYGDRSLEIYDIDRMGQAFFVATAQIAMRLGSQMSASIFMDAGNVWSSFGEINPARLYRGAGVGLQIITPMGPIGLDYAYGFDKLEPGWNLHFRLGPGA
jgi:outer membrane protein insertion porin family